MSFIRNIWYVAAWSADLTDGKPFGCVIAGEPVVIWRDSSGAFHAMVDRCPHRHAALSMGRVEGDQLRCMYHGLKFDKSGACTHVPGSDVIPPNCSVRTFRAADKDDWIWVWLGVPEKADEALIPATFNIDDYHMSPGGKIIYEANYNLVNDNLTDLSHLDYVHEKTLLALTQQHWSFDQPDIKTTEGGLLIQRWLDYPLNPDAPLDVDQWSSYRYMLPGLFLQRVAFYPKGTAKSLEFAPPPDDMPALLDRIDQQSVTQISDTQTQYLFRAGVLKSLPGALEMMSSDAATAAAAFAEDHAMIEGQQRIWNLTDETKPKAFLPQDKAPAMFRKMIEKRIKEEA